MSHLPPREDVLIWSSGRRMIGTLVEGQEGGEPWRMFMDPRTDELLPWPSHWAPLPPPPAT